MCRSARTDEPWVVVLVLCADPSGYKETDDLFNDVNWPSTGKQAGPTQRSQHEQDVGRVVRDVK